MNRLRPFCILYRQICTSQSVFGKLKIAIIGQSTFAAEVYKLLKKDGHKIVGVFTVPDKNDRKDPLAITASADNTAVFKVKSWQKGGKAISEVVENYKKVGAELNVLPFCLQFIPMEVINHPSRKSICYHPSLLPRHRGMSAISWTLINGDKEAGFSIFWADEGLDTGPILLKRSCKVEKNDTVDSLYNRFLYPEGIKAMAEAVNMVADGTAPSIRQSEEDATNEPYLIKKHLQQVNWNQSASDIHNFIRGLDSSPGAWTNMGGKEVKLYGSSLWEQDVPKGDVVQVNGMQESGIVHTEGLLLRGTDGNWVNVQRLSIDGKMMSASNYGKAAEKSATVELTSEEKEIAETVRFIWKGILNTEVSDSTDFFGSGAGSMDIVRLLEELKEKVNVILKNEDVFMATTFSSFMSIVALKLRGEEGKKKIEHSSVKLSINSMDISFPHQLFINGEFVDPVSQKTLDCINPSDESLICKVACATTVDVNNAVQAAQIAFDGEWSKMNARDRGLLLYKLADTMEAHKEELATIESIDSGAVYTLALKTHVGMSIETWRYFAGWCDKIHGTTIPISHARPSRNLTFTKKEPIGVCGLVTPWNYPLMMLSWKMAACLAAGNTVVMKPAQVSPLTALKFGELSVMAGFPPGVINILPGTGSETGNAIASHPGIRKLGFTGSTSVGQTVMRSCADSNLKKVSLELGGKSPLIIFDDCDIERAVRMGMNGVFFNKGENCIAAGRIFVESSVHDLFVEKVVAETKKMVMGDPLNRSTQHGPQNHKAHLEKLVEFCERGVKEGAILACGGKRADRRGFFFEPTVFTNVEDHMFIAQEESFGPIMVVSKFANGDIDGVIKRANNTEFGLASGVFTRDINRALYVAEKIDAGTVFVNTYNKTDVAAPFGGFKQSGFGKDLGQESLNEYLKIKCVTVEY